MPDRWIPLDPDRPLPERLDHCRARFLDLADRLRAFEEQARGELRALAEMLGEPPDYDAMCEHEKPMTAWGELYRTASALADDWESLDNDYAGFLNGAAGATDEDLLAEWNGRDAGRE